MRPSSFGSWKRANQNRGDGSEGMPRVDCMQMRTTGLNTCHIYAFARWYAGRQVFWQLLAVEHLRSQPLDSHVNSNTKTTSQRRNQQPIVLVSNKGTGLKGKPKELNTIHPGKPNISSSRMLLFGGRIGSNFGSCLMASMAMDRTLRSSHSHITIREQQIKTQCFSRKPCR